MERKVEAATEQIKILNLDFLEGSVTRGQHWLRKRSGRDKKRLDYTREMNLIELCEESRSLCQEKRFV
jgi:hypothetical protein